MRQQRIGCEPWRPRSGDPAWIDGAVRIRCGNNASDANDERRSRMVFPGGAKPHLVSGVALLRPDEQVFEAMLDGWRNHQLARNLKFNTFGRNPAGPEFGEYGVCYVRFGK